MKAARHSFQHLVACILLFSPVTIRAVDSSPSVPPKNVLEEFDVGKNGDVIIVPVQAFPSLSSLRASVRRTSKGLRVFNAAYMVRGNDGPGPGQRRER